MYFTVYTNADQVSASVRAQVFEVGGKVDKVVRHHGQLLRTRIMRNASTGFHAPGEPHIPGTGPGPNVATGDYLRTWTMEIQLGSFSTVARVGTNAVQARRLEFGFVGMDALGRVYSQPPFPHVGPAIDYVLPRFERALAAMVVS